MNSTILRALRKEALNQAIEINKIDVRPRTGHPDFDFHYARSDFFIRLSVVLDAGVKAADEEERK